MKSQYVTIGEVCCLLNGFAFKSKEYVEDGIRIIRIANVQKGTIEDSTPCFYPLSKKSDVSAYMLDAGDLLVSLTGNVGRVAMLPSEMLPAALNQRVACLRVTDESVLHKQYLFHLLNSNVFEGECIESSNGAAQKNLSTSWLKKYRFLMPDFNEQIRISREFDKLLNLVEKAEVQLATYDELVKSRFIEMFGNDSCKKIELNKLCSEIVDCPHTTPKYAGEVRPHPAIRTSELSSGTIMWDSMKYVSEEEYQERIKRLRPVAGDIVYAREGTYGNAAQLPSGHDFCLGQRVMLFRPNYSLCTSQYLLHAILSDEVKSQADELNLGSTVPHVNVKDAKCFLVPFPSLELQQEFAAFVEQVDKLKFETQQSIEKLQMLYDSLAQEYFGS